jgi:hypothetical protein
MTRIFHSGLLIAVTLKNGMRTSGSLMNGNTLMIMKKSMVISHTEQRVFYMQ